MEHVVFFSASDGSPAYRRTASLDDAVSVVEHMRNVEGVEDVHVYSLEPVLLSFRPYYRVEVTASHQPQHAVEAEAPALASTVTDLEAAAALVAPDAVMVEPLDAVLPARSELPVPPEEDLVAEPVVEAPVEPEFAAVGQSAEQPAGDPSGNGAKARGLGFFSS